MYHNAMKIVSWNVNGIRAVHKNGYFDTFLKELPSDIICFQETKAREEQLSEEIRNIPGYTSYFNHHKEKKGYAGVAMYVKEGISYKNIIYGTGNEKFDIEGRIIGAEFENFVLLNIYFPNGGMGPDRLDFKLRFYDDFLQYIENLRANGKSIIFTGDLNVAHEEIDLKHPKANENTSGFLPEERAWFDELMHLGYIDIWRHLHPNEIKYSWWNQRFRARQTNAGWRIDYFIITPDLLPFVKDAEIHNEIFGSDHCPVSLTLNI